MLIHTTFLFTSEHATAGKLVTQDDTSNVLENLPNIINHLKVITAIVRHNFHCHFSVDNIVLNIR